MCEKMRAEVLLYHTAVTFNEIEIIQKIYQATQPSGRYHHTKFERNRLAIVRIQADYNSF